MHITEKQSDNGILEDFRIDFQENWRQWPDKSLFFILLAAWIGLVPKQASSGDTIRRGRISKQGDGYLRRLLINGAQAVLNSRRAKADPWIKRLLATKPRLVAAVALANKMARIAWAVMVRTTRFRPVPAAA